MYANRIDTAQVLPAMLQLLKMSTPPLLSMYKFIGSLTFSPSDSRKFFQYIISCTHETAATHSALVTLKVTKFLSLGSLQILCSNDLTTPAAHTHHRVLATSIRRITSSGDVEKEICRAIPFSIWVEEKSIFFRVHTVPHNL